MYSCDGEQTVDVLCSGDKLAIAFEAKLGLERMGSAEFHRRFCIPCEPSKHADDRISGSMVAVLNAPYPSRGSCDLLAQIGNAQWQSTPGWWLVLRRPIVERWRKTGNFPVESRGSSPSKPSPTSTGPGNCSTNSSNESWARTSQADGELP